MHIYSRAVAINLRLGRIHPFPLSDHEAIVLERALLANARLAHEATLSVHPEEATAVGHQRAKLGGRCCQSNARARTHAHTHPPTHGVAVLIIVPISNVGGAIFPLKCPSALVTRFRNLEASTGQRLPA